MTCYPRLEIDLDKLEHNAREVVRLCSASGINVTGVIKGMSGIPEAAARFVSGGCVRIASSRLDQLEESRAFGIDVPTELLRIPMISEADRVIRSADISLNSELAVLKALNQAAGKAGKRHGVILMAEMGDLREGIWDREELMETALAVENDLEWLDLKGVGMNVGCTGAVMPTAETLEKFSKIAAAVEEKIGRPLEIISGGATTSISRLFEGDMPENINDLRVGEQILLAWDLDRFMNYDLSNMYQDIFRLKAEIIELKEKPTYPIGTIGFDAFGHIPTFTDKGIRKRALVALGKYDFGSDPGEITPIDPPGITIEGASSDHTILDVEDAGPVRLCDESGNVTERPLAVGDIVTFRVNYAALVYLTNTPEVEVAFV